MNFELLQLTAATTKISTCAGYDVCAFGNGNFFPKNYITVSIYDENS